MEEDSVNQRPSNGQKNIDGKSERKYVGEKQRKKNTNPTKNKQFVNIKLYDQMDKLRAENDELKAKNKEILSGKKEIENQRIQKEIADSRVMYGKQAYVRQIIANLEEEKIYSKAQFQVAKMHYFILCMVLISPIFYYAIRASFNNYWTIIPYVDWFMGLPPLLTIVTRIGLCIFTVTTIITLLLSFIVKPIYQMCLTDVYFYFKIQKGAAIDHPGLPEALRTPEGFVDLRTDMNSFVDIKHFDSLCIPVEIDLEISWIGRVNLYIINALNQFCISADIEPPFDDVRLFNTDFSTKLHKMGNMRSLSLEYACQLLGPEIQMSEDRNTFIHRARSFMKKYSSTNLDRFQVLDMNFILDTTLQYCTAVYDANLICNVNLNHLSHPSQSGAVMKHGP